MRDGENRETHDLRQQLARKRAFSKGAEDSVTVYLPLVNHKPDYDRTLCNGLCGCEDGSLCHEKVCGQSITELSEYTPLVNPTHRKVYVVGALKNPEVTLIAQRLRGVLDCEVFDDWHAAHPEADDQWRNYELNRGRSYPEALVAYAGQNVFQFDKKHLNESTHGLLVLPAGRSGHLELGYLAGRGASTAILLDKDYDRWDVMYAFADLVTSDLEEVFSLWTQ